MAVMSAARALINRKVTIHIDNLSVLASEDVLLEIFDAYRQLHELQPDYETAWNSRYGWFKLAHVCQHWRRVVFASSSRLQVRLLFTPRRSSRNHFLRALPRFPILFDFRTASWETKNEENLAIEATAGQWSRVRGIALPWWEPCPPRVLKALSHPFPKLESLELESYDTYHELGKAGTDFIVALLSGSDPFLRRLTVRGASDFLVPLLSSATSLEELNLTLCVPRGTYPEDLLIANLQRMSCLRRLELKFEQPLWFIAASPNPFAGEVSLPRLTDLIFVGPGCYLRMLMTRLAAPSLQHLDAKYHGRDTTFPLPQLCKYICDSGCQFEEVHLDLSLSNVKFSAKTRVKSDHAQQAFKITIPMPIQWEQIGHMLSGPLSTVGEFTIGWIRGVSAQTSHYHIPWRALFMRTPQVKMLRVNGGVALPVTHAFQLDGQEPALDILPSLEHVEVQTFENMTYVNSHDVFRSLAAARQQLGRPIKIPMAVI